MTAPVCGTCKGTRRVLVDRGQQRDMFEPCPDCQPSEATRELLPSADMDAALAAETYVIERTMHSRALPAGVLQGIDYGMRRAFVAGATWQSLKTAQHQNLETAPAAAVEIVSADEIGNQHPTNRYKRWPITTHLADGLVEELEAARALLRGEKGE